MWIDIDKFDKNQFQEGFIFLGRKKVRRLWFNFRRKKKVYIFYVSIIFVFWRCFKLRNYVLNMVVMIIIL